MPELYTTKYQLDFNKSYLVKLLKKVERVSGFFADIVITQNKEYARVLESRGSYKRKIVPILNSPDEKIFGDIVKPQKENTQNRFIFLFHGTITQRHGLDLAIEALRQVLANKNNVAFQILGNGDYLPNIINLIYRHNLQNHVLYLGETAVDEIPLIIQNSTFGIVPHRSTVFNDINVPNRVFEYVWLGKLAIVAKTKAILEYFPEGTLLYFKPGDSEDLARKMLWAIENPNNVYTMIKRSQRVCYKYRWELQKGIYLETIKNALSK